MLDLYEMPPRKTTAGDQLVLETREFILGEQVAISMATLPPVKGSRTSLDPGAPRRWIPPQLRGRLYATDDMLGLGLRDVPMQF
jgi:hypothetical protein